MFRLAHLTVATLFALALAAPRAAAASFAHFAPTPLTFNVEGSEFYREERVSPNHPPQLERRGSWAVHFRYECPYYGSCIDLKDGYVNNGQPVQLWDCNYDTNNGNQVWVWDGSALQAYLKKQPGYITHCLDAGSPPYANGRKLKIWQCYPGLAQQQWVRYYAGSWMGIRLIDYCIDVPNGSPWDGTRLQLWECWAQGWTQGFVQWN